MAKDYDVPAGMVQVKVTRPLEQMLGGVPIKAIRIHGSGDYIMLTEYNHATTDTKKTIGSSEAIYKAVKNGIPLWIDTKRLSKVQLGSVMGAVDASGNVKKEVIRRNGRPMILVRKK